MLNIYFFVVTQFLFSSNHAHRKNKLFNVKQNFYKYFYVHSNYQKCLSWMIEYAVKENVYFISAAKISCRHQISKYVYFSIGTITARLRLLKYCQFHQCHARKSLFACVKVYFLRYKELAKF